MMALARRPLSRIRGLGFWKLLGAGPDEGFRLRFNPSVYGIICAWEGEGVARARLARDPLFQRYDKRSSEAAHLLLGPVSVRGAWAGREPFRVDHAGTIRPMPVAALTRATLRPQIARRFWSRVPNIDDVIGADPNVLFKIGLGEMPALHQVTFSIWPDAKAMAQFAHKSSPHADAIRAVRQEGWFSEELYARFRVIDAQGTWNGKQLKTTLRSP